MKKLEAKNIVFIMFLLLIGIILPLSAQQQEQDSAVQLPSLCVSGIIFDENNPLVIINGESFTEGGSIEGTIIQEIDESSVKFNYKGTLFHRGLGEGCSKASQAAQSIEKTLTEASRQLQTNMAFSQQEQTGAIEDIDQTALQFGAFALVMILLINLVLYVYCSISLQLIAKKTSTAHAWMAWVPFLNLFLMTMIAQRPWWWALLIALLPITVIGVIPAIIMCFIIFMDMAAVCGKPKWLGLLPIVPVGWFIFCGYLAFSKSESVPETEAEEITEIPPGPEPAPEEDIQPESPPDQEKSQPQEEGEATPPEAEKQRPSKQDENPPIYDN